MPPSGQLYWRFKRNAPCEWRYGYCTWLGNGMVRMGAFNGDISHGSVVDPIEIEWREYSRSY